MKIGARNKLTGKVTGMKKGKLMCLVNLEVTGKNKMASVMTLDTIRDLKLKKGDKVTVVVKALQVLLIKE
jgi:molybdopterin-binding protein